MAFWPKGSSSSSVFPTIVLESGWTESWGILCDDRELWAEGTGYAVNLVILVKIFPPTADDGAGAAGEGGARSTVCAKLEITSYDAQGSIGTFTETLFPRPTQAQTIYPVTYAQIFGPDLPVDVPPDGAVDLDIDRLRDTLRNALMEEGHQLAE